jgi:transcriptional regulator with XRE-family HTH domain
MSTERELFSQRLRQALTNARYAADSPTRLAREFNLRYAGRPVTIHAVRKWLIGEAIPTQEKLQALAVWLGVSAEWLRFGPRDRSAIYAAELPDESTRANFEQHVMLEQLQRLDEHHKEILRELIRVFRQTTASAHG